MWRAGVVFDNPVSLGVEVAIAETRSDGAAQVVVSLASAQGLRYERIESMAQPPTIFIPHEIARALLDALSSHYGGASDTRTLRRDFEHERGRVDLMIKYLVREDASGRP